ncbi:hypothetical protein K438DRAFT_1873111 [Mycena galopus ATCC 62051]|nr:hypothetical protein K438DRAFT_1884557 [Mycena galopus ATCC 62051]KAF8144845.1 hypothetical protein K438DRAFT_1873111 [Mycena galopus ATCC 62051]
MSALSDFACHPSARVYHRGTQADRPRATTMGRQVWAAWDFDGMHLDEGARCHDARRSFDEVVFVTSGRIPIAVAHATLALVASPRLASSSPSPCTSYPSPCHRPFIVAVSVGAPLPPTICLLVDLCVRSSGACRHSTGRAREQASTQHEHGPLATVPHSERWTRATTPCDGTPRSGSFYKPRGTRTSRVQRAPSFFSGADARWAMRSPHQAA